MFCLAHSRGQVSAISNGPADCHSTGFCYGPAACCSTSLILCAFSFWCCFLSRWYSPRVKIATSHDPITGLCVLPFFTCTKPLREGGRSKELLPLNRQQSRSEGEMKPPPEGLAFVCSLVGCSTPVMATNATTGCCRPNCAKHVCGSAAVD